MTGQDLDPQLSASMRRTILQHARTSPRRSRSPRHWATILGSIALLTGVAATATAIIVTGLPNSVPAPPVANTPTSTATTSPPPPTSTPTPAPATTPPPTPTLPPAPPQVDATDPSTWIIGFDGVGPVELGSSLEEQRQLLPAFDDITDPLCVTGYLDLQAPSGFALRFVSAPDGPVTAAITFGNGGAEGADDRAITPTTAEGIGIGSTEDELLTAYPDIELTGTYQSDDFPYYGITDGTGGWIVFALIDDRVSRIQIAHENTLPIENVSVKTMPSERCPA
ncbi:hypothetical protein [Herbiconiux sp.]|uniref:hypothetical protein n=1 Tax=Herbiconiux sp. TaxID=1871186 RepID=UPI0025C0A5EC|nr:hypothetical protein [Herbiconiux sp.]